MEIHKPKELSININNNLNEFLNSKYQYKLNTENLRQNVLKDIEEITFQNIDSYSWNYDDIYRKRISDEIENRKLYYYTILINQSGLDDKTKYDMILNFKTGKSEDEWKNIKLEI